MPMLFDNAQQGMLSCRGELGREMLAGLKRNPPARAGHLA